MYNSKINNSIGFFDSGVGGLSVLSRFRQALPNENIIYFGDTLHLPYGNKSQAQLVEYARSILTFFNFKNVKTVVIACNTSSAQAYDIIKDEFTFPIYPIIQCCAKSVSSLDYKRIGIFATEGTVKSGKYKTELKKYNPGIEVYEIAAKNWVGIVEKTAPDINKSILEIKTLLDEMMLFQPDKIILGCTHYPYLMSEFRKYLPNDLFIDPAEIFVDYIKNDLAQKNLLNIADKEGKEEFFVSSKPIEFMKNATMFYDMKFPPNVINI